MRRRRTEAVRLTDPVVICHPGILPQIFERSHLESYIKAAGLADKGITADNYRNFIVQDQFTAAVLKYARGMTEGDTLASLEDLEGDCIDPVSRSMPLGKDVVFSVVDGYLYSSESLTGLFPFISPINRMPLSHHGYTSYPSWVLVRHPLYDAIESKLSTGASLNKVALLRIIASLSNQALTKFTFSDDHRESFDISLNRKFKIYAGILAALQSIVITIGSHYSNLNYFLALPVGVLYSHQLFPTKRILISNSINDLHALLNTPGGFLRCGVHATFMFVLFLGYSKYLTALNIQGQSLEGTPKLLMRIVSVYYILMNLLCVPLVSEIPKIFELYRQVLITDYANLSPIKRNISILAACMLMIASSSLYHEMSGNIYLNRMHHTTPPLILFSPLAKFFVNILSLLGLFAQVNKDLQETRLSYDLIKRWVPKLALAGLIGYMQFSAGSSAWESTNHAFFAFMSFFGDTAVERVLKFGELPAKPETDLFKVRLPKEASASAASVDTVDACGAAASK